LLRSRRKWLKGGGGDGVAREPPPAGIGAPSANTSITLNEGTDMLRLEPLRRAPGRAPFPAGMAVDLALPARAGLVLGWVLTLFSVAPLPAEVALPAGNSLAGVRFAADQLCQATSARVTTQLSGERLPVGLAATGSARGGVPKQRANMNDSSQTVGQVA